MSAERRAYLRRLLTPMWLRPESALWYAHEAALAREYLGRPLPGPSLELGSMEGISTFVMLGGEFGLDFDMYRDVSVESGSHRWASLADDYFDTAAEEGPAADLARPAEDHIDVGLSWKGSHVAKAVELGLYGRLVEHDPNAPLAQFEDGSFATIWGPNLYWVDALPALLGECRRLLRADGRLVTVLPDRIALDHMLYRFVDAVDDPQWIRNLDRGRYSNIARQARSEPEWLELFEAAGLAVSRHDRFLPELIFRISDVGLRPLFPALMGAYRSLRDNRVEDWRRVKANWIDVVYDHMAPLCDLDWMERLDMPKVWHIFEARPASL